MIRLDHFRGFEAYWAIPAQEDTAVNGQWIKAPGTALFQTLRDRLGELPFIAEDLGLITKEVDALREQFGLPGMKVLQFGFSGRGAHIHLPHRFVTNTVAYTGTHDNDTTRGWWEHGASETEKAAARVYLGVPENESGVARKTPSPPNSLRSSALSPKPPIATSTTRHRDGCLGPGCGFFRVLHIPERAQRRTA